MSGKILLDEVWDLRPGPEAEQQRARERARLARLEDDNESEGGSDDLARRA